MTRKTSNRKGMRNYKRSIFINLDGYMKILKGNSTKERRRIKKFIKYVWSVL